MIDEKKIEMLRHMGANSDPVVMDMLNTLEALWRVARAAETIYSRISDGTLVRSTEHDAAPDWTLRMIKFVAELKAFNEALAALRKP